jgi:hypothetical protein
LWEFRPADSVQFKIKSHKDYTIKDWAEDASDIMKVIHYIVTEAELGDMPERQAVKFIRSYLDDLPLAEHVDDLESFLGTDSG